MSGQPNVFEAASTRRPRAPRSSRAAVVRVAGRALAPRPAEASVGAPRRVSGVGLSALVMLLAVSGCGGTGSLTFTTWGEDYIEQGIPTDSREVTGFVDGWSLTYTRFLVALGEVTLAKQTGERGPVQDAARVVDLVKPGPVELFGFTGVPAEKWDRVSYAIAPASASAQAAGALDAGDLERMRAGLSILIEGHATDGAATKRFAWAFTTDTLYADCTNPDFGEGVTVPTGGQEVVQLTVHGDHFWYDDLTSPEAVLRFQAIADADADADGEVTLAELSSVPLTFLPLGQYGTGSARHVKTLADFVTALGRTVGHFRGEGDCVSHAR